MKNFPLLNQKFKTSSFEKDRRFFCLWKEPKEMEERALQALHLIKINQPKGQILLFCGLIQPAKSA